MRVAVCAGSFDPVTYGHLDILRRGARLAARLYVAVAVNAGRDALFTLDERVAMLKAETKGLRNVAVERFDGMIVDYARKRKADALLRGLRTVADFENEFQMARANRLLGKMETVFVAADQEWGSVSAKLIREVAALGGDVSAFVPKRVARALAAKMRERDPWA